MGFVGSGRSEPARSATSIEFSALSRRLCEFARAEGHVGPQFRSPPRSPSTDRSISRRPDGSCTVSIRLRGRSLLAVANDMIDGVLAANQLEGKEAGRLRDLLWSATEEFLFLEDDGQARAA